MNIYLILIFLSIVLLIHWVRETVKDSSSGNLLWVLIMVIVLITNICMYASNFKDDKKSEVITETEIINE